MVLIAKAYYYREPMNIRNIIMQRFSRLAVIFSLILLNAGCALVSINSRIPDGSITDERTESLMVPTLEMARLQPADTFLYQRIVNGFSLPDVSTYKVREYLDKYRRHPHGLQTTISRAEPFLAYIVNEVEKRQLPMELALLPIVESGYDPLVRSRSAAAGIWQIVPQTARGLGIAQNRWFDGRLDIVESTRAALDYLEKLHAMFDNDWFLALAAYNAGEGTIKKLIKRNKKNDKPTGYFDIALKHETRIFIPKLIAIRDVFRQPHRYGATLALPPDTVAFKDVTVSQRFNLRSIAAVCNSKPDLIRRLNAGLLNRISPPVGPYRVRIPTLCESELDLRLTRQLASTPITPRAVDKPQVYRVKSGDSLWSIARSFSVTVAGLAKWNKIAINGTLRLGQKLLVLH